MALKDGDERLVGISGWVRAYGSGAVLGEVQAHQQVLARVVLLALFVLAADVPAHEAAKLRVNAPWSQLRPISQVGYGHAVNALHLEVVDGFQQRQRT